MAIVSGAAGGVGRATVRTLAQAGASVMLADIDGRALEEFAAELRSKGLSVALQITDISDEAQVEALIAATVNEFGRLDILDNNAASQGHPEDTVVTLMTVEL